MLIPLRKQHKVDIENHQMVQGYDARMKGDMENAKTLFEKAFSMGHSGSGGK